MYKYFVVFNLGYATSTANVTRSYPIRGMEDVKSLEDWYMSETGASQALVTAWQRFEEEDDESGPLSAYPSAIEKMAYSASYGKTPDTSTVEEHED